MSKHVFCAVVEYIYTGRVENMSPGGCIEVLVASNMLGLKRLTQLCEKTLTEYLEPENVNICACLVLKK
jgi:hypothetical protein